MTLTEMRALLDARGLRLTKSLGQNFLHDSAQLRKITALGQLQPGDPVLEIGPGLGPLTELLLDAGAQLLAVEIDQRLAEILRERFAARANFELLEADALAFLKHASRTSRDWANWKLISNLPYSVASPILVELALSPAPPERLVATLQWEVVERIAAKPDTAHYGLLSLLLQLRYRPEQWFKIPPGCFFPPPDVDSACILLRRRPEPLLPAEAVPRFQQIVKLAFSERRKMMAKLLKRRWPGEKVTASMDSLGIDPGARAETVSLEQFIQLTLLLG